MVPVRYGILGTTQAHRADGTPVPLGGARLRALLTALARQPGRTRPAAALIEEIWPDAPPRDAPGALQALVGRLRGTLGRDAVESAPGGYRLAARPDDVDLHRFERLAEEGTQALADHDPQQAAALLDDALAMWRGPAFADLPDRAAVSAPVEARLLTARRARAEADIARGAAEAALPALTGLCRAHPLDEPLHAARIRALAAAGRPAQALAAYEEVREELAERLGTDPGPVLRALHAELLGAAPAGRPSPPPRPAPVTVPGAAPAAVGTTAGARPDGGAGTATRSGPVGPAGLVGPVGLVEPAGPVGPAGVPEGAGPRPGTAPGSAGARGGRGNLRARLTSFVGREADLDALRADLGRHRLVTLTGPGGAGKTRLSQEAAEAVADAWPDGVWLVELAPLDDPETVPEAVLTALGARETVLHGTAAEGLRAAVDRSAHEPMARLLEHCAARRLLLVLDNCEHLVDAAALLAERLLGHCPGVSVLATSREPLAVPGETVRPVDPLPDPVALRLLQDRGSVARPGFRTDDDPAACAEICRRLDGLPLAVELAAARLRSLAPRQLADRLDDRFRLLTSGSRTALPRQQTLRAVVDWSWDLLDGPERTVLRRLSVFTGGCDPAVAEEVCADPPPPPHDPAGGHPAARPEPHPDPRRGGSGPVPARPPGPPNGTGHRPVDGAGPPGAAIDRRDVTALLGSLVDKSLVVAEPDPDRPAAGMRYRLLETVAEYAAERLTESGERPRVERRHLVAYRELARTADPLLRGPEQRDWLARLETEHDNLRTALRRAAAARDEEEVLCLVLSLSWFWQLRRHQVDARHWSAVAARLGPDPFEHPVAPAPPVPDSSISVPPPLPPDLLAEARRGVRLVSLANLEGEVADLTNGGRRQDLRDGLIAAYRPGLPQTCRLPGLMWFYAVILAGDLPLLRRALDATVATCRELGLAWELAFALHVRAKVVHGQSLRTAAAASGRSGGTGTGPGRPTAAQVEEERARAARRDADESLEIFLRTGDGWGIAEALAGRGEMHEQNGDYPAAAADYREAIRYATELGALGQVNLLRARLGGVRIESADPAEAAEGERMLREVATDQAQSGEDAMSYARVYLAQRCGLTGRSEEARDLLEALAEEFRRRELDLFLGSVEGMQSWLDLLEGRPGEALRKVRGALAKTQDEVTMLVAPQIPVTLLLTAAQALAELGGERRTRTAARLLGAYDTLRPAARCCQTVERTVRRDAERHTRAGLAEAAYRRAYAAGRELGLTEAVALV
ncbi:AfsR/SARP family transcriptional regulator [Streptomyces sp. NPDC018031]|uniref:AfsR/SARP family transcriptional regulator n=1 Tax=Streptomyces sp. NPDC018031 TaxID=3365033 RepID=UPI00379C2A22